MPAAKIMSNEDYHKRPEMSNSKLGLFARDDNSLEWAESCPVDEDTIFRQSPALLGHIPLTPFKLKLNAFATVLLVAAVSGVDCGCHGHLARA